jgi:hypothetical protein
MTSARLGSIYEGGGRQYTTSVSRGNVHFSDLHSIFVCDGVCTSSLGVDHSRATKKREEEAKLATGEGQAR